MEFSESIDVPCEPDAAWRAISHPEQVLGLLPGVSLNPLTLRVPAGPVRLTCSGSLTSSADEINRRATWTIDGGDAGRRTSVHLEMSLAPAKTARNGLTRVTVDGQARISGALAKVRPRASIYAYTSVEAGVILFLNELGQAFAAALRRAVE